MSRPLFVYEIPHAPYRQDRSICALEQRACHVDLITDNRNQRSAGPRLVCRAGIWQPSRKQGPDLCGLKGRKLVPRFRARQACTQ